LYAERRQLQIGHQQQEIDDLKKLVDELVKSKK